MTNILGTASPHVIDMANAYATIAAQGQKATPYLIVKVTFANGAPDYKVKKQLTPAFDKKVTADVTDAMTQVVENGTGVGAQALGRPAAGKTGTTTNTEAVWFDGFTPQLSAAVGIYKGYGPRSGHRQERRPDLQWRHPGRYLDRVHEGGTEGAEGHRLPQACGCG